MGLEESSARNIKLTLAYDGAGFHGWQSQPEGHGRTVQGVLEHAISCLTGENNRVNAAGRTDAGVHALGQVVNFFTRCHIPADRFPFALRGVLPDDVKIYQGVEAGADFHARRSARWKTYRYLISRCKFPNPCLRHYVCHEAADLAWERMECGAANFVGRHDFRSFAATGGKASDFTRVVRACMVKVHGQMIMVNITANGFLYHMVRNMVGALLAVGKGTLMPEDIIDILAQRDRQAAPPTAPASGLYLMRVDYDETAGNKV